MAEIVRISDHPRFHRPPVVAALPAADPVELQIAERVALQRLQMERQGFELELIEMELAYLESDLRAQLRPARRHR